MRDNEPRFGQIEDHSIKTHLIDTVTGVSYLYVVTIEHFRP